MNENEKKTSDWKMIIGGIALIAVLFVGVQFIFWGLGEAIHQDVPDASASQSAPPRRCWKRYAPRPKRGSSSGSWLT